MFCTHCGRQIEDRLNFCPFCGAQVQNQGNGQMAQPMGEPSFCQVTFTRPSNFVGCAMALRIHINGQSYVLKNGQAVSVMLMPGRYNVEVSMTMVIKKTTAAIDVYGPRMITCEINPAGTMTNGLAAGPAIMKDENGVRIG